MLFFSRSGLQNHITVHLCFTTDPSHPRPMACLSRRSNTAFSGSLQKGVEIDTHTILVGLIIVKVEYTLKPYSNC